MSRRPTRTFRSLMGATMPEARRVPLATARATLALVATCARGLEEVLRDELVALGHAEAETGRGVVRFAGRFAAVTRANLWLRTAMRVVWQLVEGPADDRQTLYGLAASLAWEDLLRHGQTIAVETVGRAPAFRSTAFASLTVKDAIVDRLRERWGIRPDVNRHEPDIRIHVHLDDGRAAIGLDASGEPLSHRGYRPRGGPAPLSESLAAALLLLAGYNGSQPLWDPFCGTGTIAIEAALLATGRAPGLERRFACERWVGFDARLLDELRAEAGARVRPAAARIVASDHDPRAVAAARRNARAAGVHAIVEVERRDARALALPEAGWLVVSNPPYGVRVGGTDELAALYRGFGDALKRACAGSTAWLLVGNPALVKEVGLRPGRRVVLFNGPIECRLLRYDLFAGSRRAVGKDALVHS